MPDTGKSLPNSLTLEAEHLYSESVAIMLNT